MLASNLIDKQKFEKALDKICINKEDAFVLMKIILEDDGFAEKFAFLLYNEYVTLDDLTTLQENDIITEDGETEDDETDEYTTELDKSKIKHILTTDFFTQTDRPYVNLRTYFFRDFVTTIYRKNYEDMANIYAQLNIIAKTLTDEERAIINKLLGRTVTKNNNPEVTGNDLSKFTRLQSDQYTIQRAEIEQKINDVANVLNSANSSCFISALNKISRGTIH